MAGPPLEPAYPSRLVRGDVTDLGRIDELGALEQLTVRLPDLVGSPLSINALREDLAAKRVAHGSPRAEVLEDVHQRDLESGERHSLDL